MQPTQPRLHFPQKQNIHLEARQVRSYSVWLRRKKKYWPILSVEPHAQFHCSTQTHFFALQWNADSISGGKSKFACHKSDSADLWQIWFPVTHRPVTPTVKDDPWWAVSGYKVVTLLKRLAMRLSNSWAPTIEGDRLLGGSVTCMRSLKNKLIYAWHPRLWPGWPTISHIKWARERWSQNQHLRELTVQLMVVQQVKTYPSEL